MMKWLKWGVLAFLAGEVAMLWKKDPSFKAGLEEKEGLDKVGFVFQRLLDFNQELFIDTKEVLKRLDIEAEWLKARDLVVAEADTLKSFLVSKEWELETLGKEKAQQVVAEGHKRYEALKHYVEWYAKGMVKQYHLQEKLDEVKVTYDLLKEKAKDIKKA